jgi:hypothetical protein
MASVSEDSGPSLMTTALAPIITSSPMVISQIMTVGSNLNALSQPWRLVRAGMIRRPDRDALADQAIIANGHEFAQHDAVLMAEDHPAGRCGSPGQFDAVDVADEEEKGVVEQRITRTINIRMAIRPPQAKGNSRPHHPRSAPCRFRVLG